MLVLIPMTMRSGPARVIGGAGAGAAASTVMGTSSGAPLSRCAMVDRPAPFASANGSPKHVQAPLEVFTKQQPQSTQFGGRLADATGFPDEASPVGVSVSFGAAPFSAGASSLLGIGMVGMV